MILNLNVQLVTDYVMSRDKVEVATAACRLLIDLLPGLESSVVFQDTVSF